LRRCLWFFHLRGFGDLGRFQFGRFFLGFLRLFGFFRRLLLDHLDRDFLDLFAQQSLARGEISQRQHNDPVKKAEKIRFTFVELRAFRFWVCGTMGVLRFYF
jgi:hypothetical protein